MKASELKIGESCRHEHTGCRRVQPPEETDKVWLVTNDDKLVIVEPDVVVWGAFCFEGPQLPEGNRELVGHIINTMNRVDSISELNCVERQWVERMKELAALVLKPGTDEVIDDLHVLDYLWHLDGDYCISGDQVYHRRALDYYLGRKVEHHMLGEGTLFKIAYEYGDNRLKLEHEYYNVSRVWLSDPNKEHNLPGRGIHYGILLKMPCTCGKVVYDMFAIPGVHTGAFAYLVDEETDAHLDLRNHCSVCEACVPKVKAQLEAIDRGDYSRPPDDDEFEIGGEG